MLQLLRRVEKKEKKLWYSLDKRRAIVVSEKLVSDY